ncbi:hypothetical protein FB451DRAFT_1239109 [Mycena latifolia]|nr:hypothetical protein FB451DRAFT_1239109 [Mycena latifolia]
MSRARFQSLPSKDLHESDDASRNFTPDDDFGQARTASPTALLPTSQKARNSWIDSSRTLRLASLILHVFLVAIHVVLIGIWATKLEHGLVFSLEHQQIVSFLITAITTTFGTIYSALLVFVTQTLAMRRSLHTEQPLTVTHDSVVAWSGIGSALFQIWNQKAMHTSVIGVLSVFLYLGSILALHITTPALFALETFSLSRSVLVDTEGLPAYDPSGYLSGLNLSEQLPAAFFDKVFLYTTGSLYYLPYVNGSASLGLHEGTLYNVPKPNAGIGSVEVGATGFNITCEYLDDLNITRIGGVEETDWILTSTNAAGPLGSLTAGIQSSQPGIISMVTMPASRVLVLYSTIPIVDSGNARGGAVDITPPMNSSVSSVQVVVCSQSLVAQTAQVDPQSKIATSVEPRITKNTSTWSPFNELVANTTDNLFIDNWVTWYTSMPPSDFPIDTVETPEYVSVAALYLIQRLNLHPVNANDTPSSVMLHDLENALSELVASMFWILGHVPPAHTTTFGALGSESQTGRYNISVGQAESPLFLLQGNATVLEESPYTRLDLSIIAIVTGLVASIALALLSLRLYGGGVDLKQDVPILGTGILHAIWLYRNHPELEALLPQVEHPTDDNLREAGMVRTRLVGRPQRSRESFELRQRT